jgi:hypothetical protein
VGVEREGRGERGNEGGERPERGEVVRDRERLIEINSQLI